MESDTTDERLLTAFAEGDRSALGKLAERYERALLGLARGLLGGRGDLACDAVQEIWVRVIRFGSGFNGRSSFKTWLYRIAVNQCRNLQTTGALARSTVEAHDEVAVHGKTPEAVAASADQNDALRTAVQALSEEKRLVVLLCYHERLTHEQAAEILEIPLGTLKSRLHAALEQLRQRLGSEKES